MALFSGSSPRTHIHCVTFWTMQFHVGQKSHNNAHLCVESWWWWWWQYWVWSGGKQIWNHMSYCLEKGFNHDVSCKAPRMCIHCMTLWTMQFHVGQRSHNKCTLTYRDKTELHMSNISFMYWTICVYRTVGITHTTRSPWLFQPMNMIITFVLSIPGHWRNAKTEQHV